MTEVAERRWSEVAESLRRPYPVTIPMVLFVLLVPLYIVIGEAASGRMLHVPELPLDRAWPVQPVWALIYGPLYLFLIVLPMFIVRREDHIRRTVFAYLTVWVSAYACFLAYPTIAPRPLTVAGDGFAVWGLRLLYSADPPYNCFPSLHVAHSFVSAFTSFRVHRGVGTVATICASLVAVSTLFTRQHYVLDVIAGTALASIGSLVFLRNFREDVPERDRRVAPLLAASIVSILAIGFACYWVAYLSGVQP